MAVKSNDILVAVKAVLDADSTLASLLYLDEFSTSKVMIGTNVPSAASMPVVNVALTTNEVVDLDTKFRDMTLDIMVRANNSDYNMLNIEEVDDIGDRIKTLLDDATITISSGNIQAIQAVSETDAAADFDRTNVTLKQFSFLVNAI